jgi:hypothetical protein
VAIMSNGKIIESDGDFITADASSDGEHVVVGITERGDDTTTAMIWLTTEQADELIREIAAARVEISNARPQP